MCSSHEDLVNYYGNTIKVGHAFSSTTDGYRMWGAEGGCVDGVSMMPLVAHVAFALNR